MRLLAVVLIMLMLPALAFAASHSKKHMAAVSIPVPGAFVAASVGTTSDQTLGIANEAIPIFETSGVPLNAPWVSIPTAQAVYTPGYSLNVAAYSNEPSQPLSVLLAGTPYEVRWTTVAVSANGSGWNYFDPCDLTYDGSAHHFTDSDRNVSVNLQGATLTVNSTAGGVTCLTLVLPGGETYAVAGLRF